VAVEVPGALADSHPQSPGCGRKSPWLPVSAAARMAPSMPRPVLTACLGLLACAACEVAQAPATGPPDPSPPPPFEVGIESLYLTQAVQDRDGTVPLLRGRPGLVRIFLRASRPDLPAPAVRVHLVDSLTAEVIRSYPATSPLAVVPTTILEGARGGAWEVPLNSFDVQPGRHLVAEIDPVAGVPAERFRGTLRLPASGSLDVREPLYVSVTIVPIVQSGLVPDVTGSRTADSWLDRARALHPLTDADVQVASAYTTAVRLGADGSGWPELMAELDRKRTAEGGTGHYLGAVRVGYRSGTAGRGDLPGWTAIAADGAGVYQRVVAHELGHNFGLRHAPCGADPDSVDPAWPSGPAYAGAHIGVFGWDPLSGAIRDPATTWDHMSYCGDTSTTWTSDYGYRLALRYLEAAQAAAPLAVAAARAPSLLVSGRVRAGRVELDPAHRLETPTALPPAGPYRADLLDGQGNRLASVSFAPTDLAAEEGGAADEGHFALAVPLAPAWQDQVSGIAIHRQGRELARRTSAGALDPEIGTEPGAPGETWVRWDHGRSPELLVRDRRTGEVVAFARGGTLLLRGPARELELLPSDGVRSGGAVHARVP